VVLPDRVVQPPPDRIANRSPQLSILIEVIIIELAWSGVDGQMKGRQMPHFQWFALAAMACITIRYIGNLPSQYHDSRDET
jgi:hypothetical protein